ncbi:MAG: hypothetical protein Ct9H300mP28_09350 [Pseudomonadota bacterium]|nr:MAG: hypothetical protein Ct9H300mP28_09350 [Pseudomonadota bacterium]
MILSKFRKLNCLKNFSHSTEENYAIISIVGRAPEEEEEVEEIEEEEGEEGEGEEGTEKDTEGDTKEEETKE